MSQQVHVLPASKWMNKDTNEQMIKPKVWSEWNKPHMVIIFNTIYGTL